MAAVVVLKGRCSALGAPPPALVCSALLCWPRVAPSLVSVSQALACLQAAPVGTLPLTGVLGFAAVLYTLRQRRGPGTAAPAVAEHF